jgi:hypothetical protein
MLCVTSLGILPTLICYPEPALAAPAIHSGSNLLLQHLARLLLVGVGGIGPTLNRGNARRRRGCTRRRPTAASSTCTRTRHCDVLERSPGGGICRSVATVLLESTKCSKLVQYAGLPTLRQTGRVLACQWAQKKRRAHGDDALPTVQCTITGPSATNAVGPILCGPTLLCYLGSRVSRT